VSVRSVRGTLRTPDVRRSVETLLRGTKLCAIATVGPGPRAHVNTAYFAFGPDFALYFYSYPDSRHARHLQRNRTTAVAVFDSRQSWGGADRGLQLFGSTRPLSGLDAEVAARIYARRFRGFRTWVESTTRTDGTFRLVPFRFTPRSVTVFDERRLGGGTFVNVRLPNRSRRHASE
jgi:uncharacterized protein YhbP (UPF0306 family)